MHLSEGEFVLCYCEIYFYIDAKFTFYVNLKPKLFTCYCTTPHIESSIEAHIV